MVIATGCCGLLYIGLLSWTWATHRVIRGIWVFLVPLVWTPFVIVAYRVNEQLYRGTCRRATARWIERVRWEDGARGEAHFAVHEERSWGGTGPMILVAAGILGFFAPGVGFDLVALFHVAAVFLMPVLRPSRRFGRFTVAPGGVALQWLDGDVAGRSWAHVDDVVLTSSGAMRLRAEGRDVLTSEEVVVHPSEIPRLRDAISAYWPALHNPVERPT